LRLLIYSMLYYKSMEKSLGHTDDSKFKALY